jgi:hypothetical protein
MILLVVVFYVIYDGRSAHCESRGVQAIFDTSFENEKARASIDAWRASTMLPPRRRRHPNDPRSARGKRRLSLQLSPLQPPRIARALQRSSRNPCC